MPMNQNRKDIFSDLYRQHAKYMYGICLRYTKNSDDAQDVMQEGFVKIYNALEKFKGDANVKTWMRSVMVNTAINFYRHKQILEFRSIDTDTVKDLHSVNDKVIDQMSTDELLKVLNHLPDGYRLVFNMYAIEGYKHKEIAALLDISVGASKSQLAKARKYLQVLIEEKLGITKEDVII